MRSGQPVRPVIVSGDILDTDLVCPTANVERAPAGAVGHTVVDREKNHMARFSIADVRWSGLCHRPRAR